jgi:hypothetical protein
MLKCKERKCDGTLKPGKALHNTLWPPARLPGQTISRTGQPNMINVMKCEECGYSRTMTDEEELHAILRKIGLTNTTQMTDESMWGIKSVWTFEKLVLMECDQGFLIEDEYYNGFEVLEKLAELHPWIARKLAEPMNE